MAHRGRDLPLYSTILTVYLTIAGTPFISAASTPAEIGAIRHHELFVQIDPDRHALLATDQMILQLSQAKQPVTFSLASTLHLDRLVLAAAVDSPDELSHEISFEVARDSESTREQHITIPASDVASDTLKVTAYYHGIIDDPPKEPRHLRFVTPSETAGHIGPEGVYLSSESRWYLDLPESLSTYRLLMALPAGWTGVSQGTPRRTSPCPTDLCSQPGLTMTEWNVSQAGEALSVVANRFVTKTREWSSQKVQTVQLAAYLFPEDAHLADEYLDATARYLEAYIPILGPYPFDSFAVVENFFSSGLGMPSFTLLGSGIIKRHYVQPYALGHEIVHSWIGNSVLNRTDRGNWVEGLTTYLANYYWHELSGDLQQAHDQRRLMLLGYNLHVPTDRDYPVGQFTRKRDERDNAIGYQKSAMIFHQLRQEVGEEPFWRALKRLVAQYRWHHAEWSDLERVFAEAAGRELRWFFAQWIEREGAPELSLKTAVARPIHRDPGQSFQLTATILQTNGTFRLLVPLRIVMDDGSQQTVRFEVADESKAFRITLPALPTAIELDPESMVMRRIPRRSLAPVLNHFVTDRRRSVVLAFSDSSNGPHPFRGIVKRIEAQDHQKPEDTRAGMISLGQGTLLPEEGSVLVLGSPEYRTPLQGFLSHHCGHRLQLHDDAVTVAGTAYEGGGIAVLVNCHRQDQPGSVISLFYSMTPQATNRVARLLFFYGWNSYVVFKEGSVSARGDWEIERDRMVVSIDDRETVR